MIDIATRLPDAIHRRAIARQRHRRRTDVSIDPEVLRGAIATEVGRRLQLQYGLKVLRISMYGETGEALLSLSGPAGEEQALLTVPAEELGLPRPTETQAAGDPERAEGLHAAPIAGSGRGSRRSCSRVWSRWFWYK